MNTHRIQDKSGNWHNVAKSSSNTGAYVSFNKHGTPDRLWMPGQFNPKTVQVMQ